MLQEVKKKKTKKRCQPTESAKDRPKDGSLPHGGSLGAARINASRTGTGVDAA